LDLFGADIWRGGNAMSAHGLKTFIQANAVVLVLVNLGNLFNYIFLLVAGRMMTPDDYGLFNALNALAQVWVVPTVFLPMVSARFTVELAKKDMAYVKTFLFRSQQGLLVFGGASLIAVWMFLPFIKSYLHIESSYLVILTIVYVCVAVLYPMMAGIIQGLHRFILYAVGACGIMFIRLVMGIVLLVFLGGGVAEALVACIVGVVGALAIGLWSLRDLFSFTLKPLPQGLVGNMLKFAAPVLVTTALVILFSNLDIVFARHYLASDEAGYYATAAILGRIVFFLPGALIGVLFPSIVRLREEGVSDLGYLWVSLGITTLIGISITVFFSIWSEFMVTMMYTEKYIQSAPFLPIISLAMAILGAANLLFTYYLARSEFLFLLPLGIGVVSFAAGVELFHGSAMEIALVLLVTIFASTVISFIPVLRRQFSEAV